MRQYFELDFAGHKLVLQASDWTGQEELLVDGEVVSSRRNFRFESSHDFSLPGIGELRINFKVDAAANRVMWQLQQGDRTLEQGSHPYVAVSNPPQQNLPQNPQGAKKDGGSSHFVALAGIAFKLFKSGAAIKVALAGTAFAGWSLLLSWQFAVIILSIIVFHEYGHIRAMKKCGLETKGIYLIPFLGGLAVGDRAKTYWHEVYISMMGPVFGLYMSIAALIAYLATGIPVLGLVATYSSLVNLFNLLPVYPLDGGHVLKAACLSFQGRASWIVLLTVSAAGFAIASWVGLYFIAFFFILGALDLIGAQSSMRDADVVPMKPYGAAVSLAWLVAVASIFIGIIVYIANTEIPGSEIPLMILSE